MAKQRIAVVYKIALKLKRKFKYLIREAVGVASDIWYMQ